MIDARTSRQTTAALTLAALGVVYGDIGTSPLYAFKEAFGGSNALPVTQHNVYAVLSMMFWAVTLIVSLKYVTFMLRYDNRGEGGVLALLTFALQSARNRRRLHATVVLLGAFAASLFYGDAIITPAISVLSAVEGLSVVTPRFEHWVVPIAIALLTALFMVQRRGTARIGRVFGPIMVLWFSVIALLGVASIMQTPGIVAALHPGYAVDFAIARPGVALIALGAVFLCLTGAEALYADMGHFGKIPIRIAWYSLVFPALMLNYFGQGALVLRDPAAAKNPFYMLAPEPLLLPLVVLATVATIIASQATISAAYSVTQQASRLNFLPRLRVLHTSDTAQGQIYVPLVNWLMLLGVVSLVLGFGSSSALAGAYGIAVNGDMIISSVLLTIVVLSRPGRTKFGILIALVAFIAIEATFLTSNLSKIMDGGWFPLVLAAAIFTVLSTWRRGVELLQAKRAVQPESREDNVRVSLAEAIHIPRTGVFFSSRRTGYPSAFLRALACGGRAWWYPRDMTSIVPCIWFDDQAAAAGAFYAKLFPAGRVVSTSHYPETADNPGGKPRGSVLTVEVELAGQRFTLLNGGTQFRPNPTISFFVNVGTVAEADRMFKVFADGGNVMMALDKYPWSERYGWVADRYGVSWQVTTRPGIARTTITPCLMFTGPQLGRAEEAIRFYTSIFPDARVGELSRYGKGQGGAEGTIVHGPFVLAGQDLVAMDSHEKHGFNFNEGLSLQVMCADQAEIDRFWDQLAEGGSHSVCGWLKDRFGVSWQISPVQAEEWLSSKDTAARDRMFAAMIKMRKLDVAELERAFRGKA